MHPQTTFDARRRPEMPRPTDPASEVRHERSGELWAG